MSVFIGEKGKRVELAERKDAINPNLLLNSRDFSSNWTIDKATVTSDSYNGGKVVSIHPGGSGDNPVTQAIQTPPSQPVTWSVYAKADNAGDKLHSELWGNSGATDQALTTGWCRYTFNGTFNPTNHSLYFWGVSGNKGDIHIALPKLEKGPVATDWCPAYDDYASNSGFNSLQNTVKADETANKTNVTNLQNTVNSKVNVDGPLYKDLTQFNNWSDLFDGYSVSGVNATNDQRLVAFRDDTNGGNTVGGNGDGIAFGGGDTKGVLSVQYENHQARIAGGNGTAPTWHEDIAWKSDITNLQNTIQANKTDVTNLANRVTALENQKPTKADSQADAVAKSKNSNNEYYW